MRYTMKKLLCIILAALTLITVCACGASEGTSSVDESKAPASESSSESQEESKPSYLEEPTINGNKLSEYAIVYADTTECAKYKTVALDLYNLINDTYGIKLTFRSNRLPEQEKEILVGIAETRQACAPYKSDYGYGGYKMAIKGSKVIFASSYANGTYFACEEFKKLLASGNEISETEVEGSENVVKVVCVGDSIIQGINSADNINRIYPAYLQGLLGWNYYVLNAGISGYSIVSTDEYAYCKSAQYTAAKDFDPDVVLFSLGANDANPTPSQPYKSWDNLELKRKENFLRSTRELLDSFYEVNPDVQIILSYPTSLCKNGGDKWNADGWNANIIDHVRPLLEQIVAEYELYSVDMWPWSQEHPEYFPDGLHPKDETYLPYAEYVYGNIKDEILSPDSLEK